MLDVSEDGEEEMREGCPLRAVAGKWNHETIINGVLTD